LVLVLILFVFLPESVRFLTSKGGQEPNIIRILRRVDRSASIAPDQSFVLPEEKVSGLSVMLLFRDGRAPKTMLLWLVFFINLLVLYFLATWLPSVLRQTGIPLERAIIATAALYLGGIIGSLVFAHRIDRVGPRLVLPAAYLGSALFTAAIGVTDSLPLIMLAIFAAGFCVIGAQISLNAVAADIYPTAIRSTGIGWAFGAGRVGSIVGPVIGGMMISSGIDTAWLFVVSAIPALIACAAVLLLVRTRKVPVILHGALEPKDA
jgi:AAHS family 4-hydroxybenzoate transporter-like MFS transporter